MLADRINDIDCIGRIHFDLHRVQSVASEQRVTEDGIAQIGYTIPSDTLRLTATQDLERIDRNLHCQVESVILGDEALCIANGVGEQTGRVVVLAVESPDVRGIQYTDRCRITVLGYNAQLVNNLTAGYLIDTVLGVGLGNGLRNRIAHPENGITIP